jgi:hypothetical protein
MSFWKVADLWHTLMTGILGYDRYAAAGCDVGALVTGQLGHKYADALYGIHIGSGQKLTLFNGDRAWDLSGGRPIPSGLPADIHAQVVNGGDVETVFTKDELCTHAMIFWVTNTIGTSMRTYANNNRFPWTPSHDGGRLSRPPPASPSSATRTRPASGPTSASSTSWRATAPAGTTTSTSPPTTTAATSSPGRSPTSGSTTCGEPSAAAARFVSRSLGTPDGYAIAVHGG